MSASLIVGFDGSDASAAAVRWAIEEGALRSARVRVISSYAMSPVMEFYGVGLSGAAPGEVEGLREACRAQLEQVITASRCDRRCVDVTGEALGVAADAALLSAARNAELVVIGNSRAGALSGLVRGSVSTSLLHRSPCPVALIPPGPRAAFGRVVVGSDGSAGARKAVDWAVGEAVRRGATLAVLHAWDYPYAVDSTDNVSGAAAVQRDATLLLDEVISAAGEDGPAAVEPMLVGGGAADALIRAGESADMVVVGSRGRGGFRSLLLGSVALAVSVHATCPVVVVR